MSETPEQIEARVRREVAEEMREAADYLESYPRGFMLHVTEDKNAAAALRAMARSIVSPRPPDTPIDNPTGPQKEEPGSDGHPEPTHRTETHRGPELMTVELPPGWRSTGYCPCCGAVTGTDEDCEGDPRDDGEPLKPDGKEDEPPDFSRPLTGWSPDAESGQPFMSRNPRGEWVDADDAEQREEYLLDLLGDTYDALEHCTLCSSAIDPQSDRGHRGNCLLGKVLAQYRARGEG